MGRVFPQDRPRERGVWIIPTLLLFSKWYWAALLPACAIAGNAVSMRFQILRGIERATRYDFGTIFFPVSFVICIALFFDGPHREAAAVGIMIMGLGDAAAAVFGKAFGRHKYAFLGARKSLEGSARCSSCRRLRRSRRCSSSASLRRLPPPSPSAQPRLERFSSCGAVGLDNLTVPIACSSLAFILLAAWGG